MKKQIKIQEVKTNPNNPRIIKDDKFKKLVKSIIEFPEMLKLRPIVVDENMIILGGNMRYRACIEAGLKEVWVETAKGLTEDQKKEFIIKDNASFGEWEWDMLSNEWNSAKLEQWGIDTWQNKDDILDFEQELLKKEFEEKYSQSITTPIYKPTGKKPKLKDLYDETKTNELIDKIKSSKLNTKEKNFLINAAHRHRVFDYSKIAEYYAHSDKEVQELMELSALVIIDYDKAIENGYVQLSEYLINLQDNE